MDLVLTIVFYGFAILAVVGALAAALSATASHRLLGLIGVAVGTAGVLISFSAWIVALPALIYLGASALLNRPGRGRARARPTVMILSFGHAPVVGAALTSGGALAGVWRRGEGGSLAALPALTGGTAICMAAVIQFAATGRSSEAGQELAALICVMGLAASILGAAWMRGRPAR